MRTTSFNLLVMGCWMAVTATAADSRDWKPLFNQRDLAGWDTYLASPVEGKPPLGINRDPMGVFTVIEHDGAKVIRVSGEVYGALTSHGSFSNIHIRVEYKWGQKKWPPRAEPRHYRDSGILYWCVGPHGAGSGAWMRSVEYNVMEKGMGQWWGVAGTYVDIEGRKVTLEREPAVPYRGESKGEECILYVPGGPQFTTYEGITSMLDPEKAGEWNVAEVIAWGNAGIHLLNGEVVLVLMNPRYQQQGREYALTHGRIQLQSEAAELYYRKIEVREITAIPTNLLAHVPRSAPDEKGFVPMLGKTAQDGWAQCGPGHFELAGGVATGLGGMGLWWHTNRMFTNFVMRGEFLQEEALADSGIFLRFPAPGNDPWNAVRQGHEVEIGDPRPAKPEDATGSFYPFQAPASVPVKPPGQWNDYEITVIEHNYSFRLNDRLVNTWTDNAGRSIAGYIGLQNYNDGKVVRHRNLRVKDLPRPSP